MSQRKVTKAVAAQARDLKRRGGLTQRAIAERLDISKGSVHTALHEEPEVEIPADAAAAAEWAMAELRELRPDVADELDTGEELTGAIALELGAYWAALYATPKDLAQLVLEAVSFPGETDDAPKDEGAAELARAVTLLEGALAIVRKRGIDSRWKQHAPKRRARR